MSYVERNFQILAQEHQALMREYGRVQLRCSEQLRHQQAAIKRLECDAMRLRASVMVRDSALAWAREDREALERSIPGLPRRALLARRVDELLQRVQELMQERQRYGVGRIRVHSGLVSASDVDQGLGWRC